MTNSPSPFEPGYVPPEGSKLPPPPEPARLKRSQTTTSPARARAGYTGPGAGRPNPGTSHPNPATRLPNQPEPAPARSGKATAIILTAALSIGAGFGLGYVYSQSSDSTNPSAKTTPSPTESPGVHALTDAEREELVRLRAEEAQREAEANGPAMNWGGSSNIQIAVNEDGRILFGDQGAESTRVEVGDLFGSGGWAVRVAESPRDATDEITVFQGRDPQAGGNTEPDYEYRMIELTITRLAAEPATPGEMIDLFAINEDFMIHTFGCDPIPDSLFNLPEMQQGEEASVNACLEVPEGEPARWQFRFNNSEHFHVLEEGFTELDFVPAPE